MNLSFYIGAVGAYQQQQSMSIQGNNIANVNTTGFKAEKSRFSHLMYGNMRAIERETVEAGVGACVWTTDTDFSTGAMVRTGMNQDYMIDGNGFFVLVDLNTNELSLTRNGAFCVSELRRNSGMVDDQGNPIMEIVYYLSDGDGRFVLGENGAMIEVEDPEAIQPVGIFDYISYNGMEHLDDTRFLAVDKNGAIAVGSGTLKHKVLEGSNVDLANEMTKVIETQRAYSMALKMVTTSDEIETTINNLRN